VCVCVWRGVFCFCFFFVGKKKIFFFFLFFFAKIYEIIDVKMFIVVKSKTKIEIYPLIVQFRMV